MKVFVYIFLLVFCIKVSAQDKVATKQRFRIGVLAGGNMATLVNSENQSNIKVRFAGRAGLFFKYQLNKSFFLNLKGIYSQQGFRFDTDYSELLLTNEGDPYFGEARPATGVVRLDYIQVPLTLEYKINRFSFELGPQIGFNVKAEQELEDQNWDIDYNEPIVLGGVAEVNFYLWENLYMSLTYERGFSKLYKDFYFGVRDTEEIIVKSKSKYSLFSLSANWVLF